MFLDFIHKIRFWIGLLTSLVGPINIARGRCADQAPQNTLNKIDIFPMQNIEKEGVKFLVKIVDNIRTLPHLSNLIDGFFFSTKRNFLIFKKSVIFISIINWITRKSSKHYVQHTEPLDSYFNFIKFHQQCMPWSSSYWRSNQRPQNAELKLNHWATDPHWMQIIPNVLVIIIVWSINLMLSNKKFFKSLKKENVQEISISSG